MSNITDWINTELYPTLFYDINRALPGFNFKQNGRNWVSTNKLKVTGETGDSIGKVYVWENAPGYIKDFTRNTSSIIDYVKRRDGVEFIQAVKTLADVAGLQVPNSKNFNPETYQRQKDQATLLETCNTYFTFCLEPSSNAKDVRGYLDSRGYSSDDIKAMELGFIPSQEKLFKELLRRGYSQELIDETIKLNPGIGSTHSLSIPYRSGGSIKGFKFRTIGDATPKYLNSTDLDRNGGFFNLSPLKGDKDVVIVEGELDSLHATIRGVENVVATGGSSINPEQVKDAIRRGAKSFTLCLDTEPGKEEETAKKVNKAIEVILGEGVNRVYIVTLPDLGGGKTDPDRLIKEKGVDEFKKAIDGAQAYYTYWINNISTKYYNVLKETGELQPKEVDNLIEEIVQTSGRVIDPIDKDRYKQEFKSMDFTTHLGITEESINAVVDKITYNKAREDQAKELKNITLEATKNINEGDIDKAKEILEAGLLNIKTTSGKYLLPPPMSFTSLLDEIATIPPDYKTGYSSLDEFVGFTPGAITLIAGRPSHGKTTLLFNLLLEMSRIYNGKNFYYFTYEEPVKNLSIKLLNRLTATDLRGHFNSNVKTNYEFLKSYITAGRTDINSVEEGKRLLQELIDSQRIKIIGRNYSVEELSKLLAYANKKENIGGVFIDYIQRMRTEKNFKDTTPEIAYISKQVLEIAKETGLPIILGAQLNRATSIGKPSLENLKASGSLEEDANTVLSVYNESREKDESQDGASYNGQREVGLEIKALKNREGEVNRTTLLTFDKWTGVIKNDSKNSGSNIF